MSDLLLVNDLIAWTDYEGQQTVYRILWIDEARVIAYLIDIYASTGFPKKVPLSEINEGVIIGNPVRLLNDPWVTSLRDDDLSTAQKEIRDKAFGIVEYILYSFKEQEDIFKRNKRGPIIQKTAQKYEISVFSVYKYLRLYWQRGQCKNALATDYSKCGGRGTSKKDGTLKRGRKRKYARDLGEGVNVNKDIKRIFAIAYKRWYRSTKKNTLRFTYKKMLAKFFKLKRLIVDGNLTQILIPDNEKPTYEQFEYWFERYKEKHLVGINIQRIGKNKFNQINRAMTGRSDAEVKGPGARFQIDATIADIYLVSRYNRTWIIGRPVIYVIIDVFSRMICGLYIGLEGPSWLGAMMAIANCAEDKVKFCKKYGVEISPADWSVLGLPEKILGDNGELADHPVETLSTNLHVQIENAAAFRPDWKGIVEQHFRIIQARVKPLLPGTIDVDFRERGGHDYRLDAVLDLKEFTQIIIECILFHNNEHYQNNYHRDERLIADGIRPIARELWDWGAMNISGDLRYFPEDIVKLNLMPTAEARVTESGIKYKGRLRFTCDQAIREHWFERARIEHTWKIKISYDPRNTDYIYIPERNGMDYVTCSLLDSEDRYRDKTDEEIEYLLNYENLESQKNEFSEINKENSLIDRIEGITQSAQKKMPDKSELGSNASRTKGIRGNRANEKLLNREQEAFKLKGTDKVAKESVGKSYALPDDIEFFRKKQKEKLNAKR